MGGFVFDCIARVAVRSPAAHAGTSCGDQISAVKSQLLLSLLVSAVFGPPSDSTSSSSFLASTLVSSFDFDRKSKAALLRHHHNKSLRLRGNNELNR